MTRRMRFTDLRDRRAGDATQGEPVFLRGQAQAWPAVKQWSFAGLRSRVANVPVRLVMGNRERQATRFLSMALHDFLGEIERAHSTANAPTASPLYLKEFDLLKAQPGLADELPYVPLLPPHARSFPRCWIGAAGTSTGLHHDLLDNVFIQISGVKRWRLVRKGAVQALGGASAKFDEWAKLASMDAAVLATLPGAEERDFFTVDLHPGDVLHVPAGWWHEVENLTPTVGLAVFHAWRGELLRKWLWVAARSRLHQLGILGRGHCTCHASQPG